MLKVLFFQYQLRLKTISALAEPINKLIFRWVYMEGFWRDGTSNIFQIFVSYIATEYKKKINAIAYVI